MATQKQLVGAEDCIGINFPAKRRMHRKLQRCLKNAKNIAAILLPLGKFIAWLITLLLNSYLLWHELRLETTSREGYPIREGSGVSTKSAPASGHSRWAAGMRFTMPGKLAVRVFETRCFLRFHRVVATV